MNEDKITINLNQAHDIDPKIIEAVLKRIERSAGERELLLQYINVKIQELGDIDINDITPSENLVKSYKLKSNRNELYWVWGLLEKYFEMKNKENASKN
jgi:hypothetical protein